MRTTIRRSILLTACMAAGATGVLSPAAQARSAGHKHHRAHASGAVPTLAQCKSLDAEMVRAAQAILGGQNPRTGSVSPAFKEQLAQYAAGYEACFEGYGYEFVVAQIPGAGRS